MRNLIHVEHLRRPGEIRCESFMATKNLDFIFAPGMLWLMREGQVIDVPRWLIDLVLELDAGIPISDKAAVQEFLKLYKKKMADFNTWKCHGCPKGLEREGRWRLYGSKEKYCKKCYDRLFKRLKAHPAPENG